MAHKNTGRFEDELATILPKILRMMTRQQETVFSTGDLSVPNIVILELLQERGSCRMSEIAASLSIGMSAATAIIDQMIGRGLVERERSREDRRVVNVSLQRKGRNSAVSIREGRRKVIRNLFSGLTQHEKELYLTLIKKIEAGIQGGQR